MKTMVKWATLGCMLTLGAASGETLYWGGANGTWGVGQGGWTNRLGEACTFTEGDHVNFLSSENPVEVTLVGSFSTGDILVDSSTDVTFKATNRDQGNGRIDEATGFVKRGAGSLFLNGFEGSFTCPMQILEGWVEDTTVNTANSRPATSTIFGDLTVERTITIGCGDPTIVAGVRRMNGKKYLMGGHATDPMPVKFVLDGGRIYNRGSYSESHFRFGELVLKNGGNIQKDMQFGYYYFNDSIRVERGTQFVQSYLQGYMNHSQSAFVFGAAGKKPIEIYVEDVTNPDPEAMPDDLVDLFFDGLVKNLSGTKDGEPWETDSSWVKTGPGRMKATAGNSTFTGDVVIREGVVDVGNVSAFGNTQSPNKTIWVQEQGTVNISGQTFVSWNAAKPQMTFVISNGTVNVASSGFFSPGNLHIYGTGKINYSNGYHSYVGVIGFGGYNRFETDEPYVFRGNIGNNHCSFDYRNEMQTLTGGTVEAPYEYVAGYTEFDVKPAKTHPEGFVDLRMDLQLKNACVGGNNNDYKYRCGLLKTGTGIMELTASSGGSSPRQPLLPTLVREGGLILTDKAKGDGNYAGTSYTNAVVSSGAVIGGNGRVGGFINGTNYNPADLILEEGGGFLVDATNTTARLRVSRNVILPTKGLVRVYNVEEMDVQKIAFENLPLPQVAGEILGWEQVEPDQWRVEIAGIDPKETRNLKVTFDPEAATYSIGYRITGTSIVIR